MMARTQQLDKDTTLLLPVSVDKGKNTSSAPQDLFLLHIRALPLLAWTYGANFLFHNAWCSAMFRCGCVMPPPISSGWQHCNVHNMSGPRCPWCLAPPASAWVTELLPMLTMFAFAYYWSRPTSMLSIKCAKISTKTSFPWKEGQCAAWSGSIVVAGVLALLPWLVMMTVVGFAFKLYAHYPYFFFK
eukprot:m.153846 g.153846  ORF g.153846 m.153846 type:complete len:187 (-) comp30855_c0_seq1:71-631(-)